MSQWWKLLASLWLVGHFCAVLSAVVAVPLPGQPAPELAAWLNRLARPYLDKLFLSATFRFYAPNPAPSKLLWCRLERTDAAAEWIEVPRLGKWEARTGYLRCLAMTGFLDSQLGPDPSDPTRLNLTPGGQICIRSIARHVARQYDRADNRVVALDLYSVQHRLLEPGQIIAGWRPRDLRLYRACQLGRFSPEGELVSADEGERGFPHAVESSRVAARMLRDLAANRGGLAGSEQSYPLPLGELLKTAPALYDATGTEDDLNQHIQRLAKSKGAPSEEPNSKVLR